MGYYLNLRDLRLIVFVLGGLILFEYKGFEISSIDLYQVVLYYLNARDLRLIVFVKVVCYLNLKDLEFFQV